MKRRPGVEFDAWSYIVAMAVVIGLIALLLLFGDREAHAADLDLTLPPIETPAVRYASPPEPAFSIRPQATLPDRTKTLLWTATLLLAVDWLQTRDIATNPRFEERNPILGSDPDLGDVNRYFAGAVAATWVAGHVLPEPWNDRFLLGVVTTQGVVVAHNFSVGVRWRF